ncbi:MAG: hypothetical protein OXT67_05685, partial [Zetaproteobacteria bacterium]|nr:hypothetical protein [Zetaproteobacteria bacterium]
MIFKSIFQRSTKLILLISSYLSGFAHLYGQGIGIHYLHTQTNHSLKFPNGNIVVQLQPQQFGFTSKEIPWLGQLASTIHITAPGNLNPDQIIEIMLTAWTLKQYGAHHIALTPSSPIQRKKDLPQDAILWMVSIAEV